MEPKSGEFFTFTGPHYAFIEPTQVEFLVRMWSGGIFIPQQKQIPPSPFGREKTR